VIVAALLLSWVAADLASGIVHWMADTWGDERMPVLGPALIKPFREHHVDPLGITRHDFVETNGNTALVSLPVVGLAALMPSEGDGWGLCFASQGMFGGWVLMTNQIHKWAHQPCPPGAVAALQRLGLVLSPAHHARHHAAPHASHYCITTGWLDGPAEALGLFRRLERLVTGVTGLTPRAYLTARAPATEH
jgi:ubiquitin-conjugating enzyme E2 variant